MLLISVDTSVPKFVTIVTVHIMTIAICPLEELSDMHAIGQCGKERAGVYDCMQQNKKYDRTMEPRECTQDVPRPRMDEIDAAPDFKNVSIVANYIKERIRNSQFIIISLRYISS